MSLRVYPLLLAALMSCFSLSQGVEVILAGGVALKSWEHYRGKSAHDNWWANFVRASTVQMEISRQHNADSKIVWIVFRPAYITRGKEEGKDLISCIKDLAVKYKVKLVFVDTADEACEAINKAGMGGDPITEFYYFGHSTAHAFMLDYSNGIIAASKQWIHEQDIAAKIRKEAFAPNPKCRSYGCYTGNSMSKTWLQAMGFPLWGNTDSTRYQPVGEGYLPMGAGEWVSK